MSIVTTGIKNAPMACRLEIRTFVQDKDVFNLYVLAIDKMFRIDQTDPSSWFQLAGIHGRYVSQHASSTFHSPQGQALSALEQCGREGQLRRILLPLVCPLP